MLNKGRQEKEDEAQLAQDDGGDSDSDQVLLMVTTSDCDNSDNWYLDIGCSNHMTGNKEWFVSLDESVKSKIRFANNSTVTTEGIGKVLIQRKDGKKAFITDVLYVPQMNNNLLSLGQLLQKGYVMKMEHGVLKVFNSQGRMILKAPLSKNRTFKTEIQVAESQCLAATTNYQNWLWHLRFGHLNFRSLSLLKMEKWCMICRQSNNQRAV